MSSIPYDWAFNANRSIQSIPGVVTSDNNGNVAIVGRISTDSSKIYSDGSGNLTVSKLNGDVSNSYISYTNSTNNTETTTLISVLEVLPTIENNFNTSGEYIGVSKIDNSQINSDGNGKLSVNNLDIGNQKSTSLVVNFTTYDDSPIGNTTIDVDESISLDSSWTYYITGTGIPDNTSIISVSEETDSTSNTTYYKITISNSITSDIAEGSEIVVTRISNTTNINFYTSGNSTSNIGIKITGSVDSNSTITDINMDSVIITSTSITFDGNKILFSGLPTEDPKVVNQLWINGGVLMLSQG